MKTNRMSRRTLLKAAGLVSAGAAFTPEAFFGQLGQIQEAAAAATPRRNLILVRSLFDFRDPAQTNFNQYLKPLAPWQTGMTLVQGLTADGAGSEYHNGKQIRFATSSAPEDRTNRNRGGGDYDGKSVDVVTGEHQQAVTGSRHPYLVLGAAPYSASNLHGTFETITFANKGQYVRPQYDITRTRDQVSAYALLCESQVTEVDVAAIEQENQILEAVMLDLSRSREMKSVEVVEQAEALEAQFLALRNQNQSRLQAAPMCITARETALGHTYTRHNIVTAAFDRQVRNMNHAAAMALKTNFTNVVTLNYNFSGHGQPNVPAYHEMTHPGGFSRPPTSQELQNLDGLSAFQTEMFAHLLRELSDFGVLDQTLVVYSPHERPTHNHRDVPLLAHGAGRTGARNLDKRNHDVNRDILEHFGISAGNFGGERSAGGIIT